MSIAVATGAGNVTTAVASSGTSIVVNKPSNTADGDLLVALLYHREDAGYSTVPSGWTLVPSQPTITAGSGSLRFYTKPIPSAASESPTSYTWSGATPTGRQSAVIVRVTGANASPIDGVSATSATVVTNTITAPAATAGHPAGLVLAGMSGNTTGGDQTFMTAPSGMTTAAQAVTNTGATNSQAQIATVAQVSAGSTGTKQWTTTAGASLGSGIGFLLVLRPTSSAPIATPPALQYRPVSDGAFSIDWGTFSDGGTVTNLTVTQVANGAPTLALSGTGLATRTATPTVPGYYQYSAVATDGDSQDSSPAVATVAVYSVAVDSVPYAQYSNAGGWTNVSGASASASVSNPSTTDYVQSPVNPTGAVTVFRMTPAAPGSPFGFSINAQWVDSAANVTVDVLQGAGFTQVATKTVTLSNGWLVRTFDLTGPEATAFSDRATWAVRLTADTV